MKRHFKFFAVAAALMLATCGEVARARATETPAPLSSDSIIYPKATNERPNAGVTNDSKPGNSSAYIVAVFILGAGGVWLWMRRRSPAGLVHGRSAQKLSIAETKSLGNRQFLIVAAYEDKKFLLGVCPGRIELLTSLDNSSVPGTQK